MTLLTAVQSAAIRLVGRKPASVFSSTDKFSLEMQDLATETAVAIAKAHDWRRLTKKHTITGNDVTVAHPLPSDFDRMPLSSNLYSTRSQLPLARARDLDEWIEFEITPVVGYPGYWIINLGNVEILPALATGEEVKFYYITNQIVSGNKTGFTTDADTFVLSERLLTLGLIWRWRAQKRLEYSEDLRNYELAFQEEAGRDKGSRVISVGRARVPVGVDVAYPGQITP
jgi:hypothetical protein